jgi:hypothetical protein
MPWVGFWLTIPVFERAKTVHALDRAATVIGPVRYYFHEINILYVITWIIATCNSEVALFVVSCNISSLHKLHEDIRADVE